MTLADYDYVITDEFAKTLIKKFGSEQYHKVNKISRPRHATISGQGKTRYTGRCINCKVILTLVIFRDGSRYSYADVAGTCARFAAMK